MNPLENVQVRLLLKTVSESVSQRVTDFMLNSKPTDTQEDLRKVCDQHFDQIKARHAVNDFQVGYARICTKFEVHDEKNRCFVRLMDKDDMDIQFVWLKGRRKAKKVGRQYIGSVFLEYSYTPPPMAQRVEVRGVFKKDAA
jgi:hypothetical protein